MDNDIDLTALRAFRMVLREGSFSAAALALRVPKSTLSKRIADLETELGVRLIERSTRALRPTREGEVLASRADRLLGEAEDIRRALGEPDGAPRGHLRLSVTPTLGTLMMGRIAADFRARYPDVTLEIHFLDRAPDLLEEGFDGCLHFGPLEDSSRIARLMLHGQAVLAAHPDLPGLDRIRDPEDLLAFPLVGLAAAWRAAWPLESGDRRIDLPAHPVLQLGSHLAIRDALRAGAGIGAVPTLMMREDLDTGRLVRVLPEWTTQRRGLYFVYPSAHSVTARLRAFIDHLAEALKGV